MLEVFFICPMERLKVWLMTQVKKDKNLRYFFRTSKGELLSSLFKGLNASFSKQVVSWVTFLAADDFFKNKFRQQHNTGDNLSYS